MLVYAMLLIGMMVILNMGNHPYPGKVLREDTESTLAAGLSTEEEPVEAEDIKLLVSADVGKTMLFGFEKDGEMWWAFAAGDLFSMRYDLAYYQLEEVKEDTAFLLQDYFHEYTYNYVDGELVQTAETFELNHDLVLTVVEIAVIVLILVGTRRKEMKKR